MADPRETNQLVQEDVDAPPVPAEGSSLAETVPLGSGHSPSGGLPAHDDEIGALSLVQPAATEEAASEAPLGNVAEITIIPHGGDGQETAPLSSGQEWSGGHERYAAEGEGFAAVPPRLDDVALHEQRDETDEHAHMGSAVAKETGGEATIEDVAKGDGRTFSGMPAEDIDESEPETESVLAAKAARRENAGKMKESHVPKQDDDGLATKKVPAFDLLQEPKAKEHDPEANVRRANPPPRKRYLTGDERGWLASAVRATLPPLTDAELDILRDDAVIKVRQLVEGMQREDADAHWVMMTTKRIVKGTTAYADISTSPEFLELLRDLRTGEGPDAPTVLEALAGEIETVKRLVNPPFSTLGAESPQSLAMRSELNRISDNCASSVAALSIDRKGSERAGKVALISSMTTLPILAGYYHDPKSYFYLAQVAGAYSRTAAMATGLVRSPQTDNNVLWDHAKDRQILWCLPFFLFFATTFGPLIAPSFAEKAKELGHSKGLLIGLAGVAFGIYTLLDHSTKLDLVRKKIGITDAGTREYARGELSLGQVEGTADDVEAKVLDSLKRINGYVNVINAAREEYKDEQPLSTTLAGQLLHVNKDVEDLKNNLALASDRIKEYLGELAESDEAEGATNKGKGRVSAALFAVAVVLSTVSSAAVSKEPLLLTDYAPYYVASLIRLGLEIKNPAYSAEDIEATFANLFGGALVGFPASAANVGLLYSKKQSWVDLSLDELFGNPDGPKIGFGMFTAYLVLINLTLASKAGPYIATRVVALLKKSATPEQRAEIDTQLPALTGSLAQMLDEKAQMLDEKAKESVDDLKVPPQAFASSSGMPPPLPTKDDPADKDAYDGSEAAAFGGGFGEAIPMQPMGQSKPQRD